MRLAYISIDQIRYLEVGGMAVHPGKEESGKEIPGSSTLCLNCRNVDPEQLRPSIYDADH